MLAAIVALIPSTLIVGGTVVDGTGGNPFIADLRIRAGQIIALGKLRREPKEVVINARGLVVAPGFVDTHSHADGGIEKDPTALSQITQGITTAVIGQDGAWREPVLSYGLRLNKARPAINFSLFSGHGGIRAQVMGDSYKRKATSDEIAKMAMLIDADMKAGALGLSTGLEYDPGYYSDTAELVALARVASEHRGLYISHMRDEGDSFGTALNELLSIGRDANLPVQVSHIKLCTAAVWGKAGSFLHLMSKNQTSADIYPYLFWQSSVSALTPSREWQQREIWVKALRDVGGAQNVRLTSYSHEPTWIGKNLAEIATTTGRDTIEIIQEVLAKTKGPSGSGEESVAVTAMYEPDLIQFMKSPRTMFCSDGAIGGSHPRGAGSFPRVLARYVRELKVLSLPEAIRKMTSLPCRVFKLANRGVLARAKIADLVIFDPKTIQDLATASDPKQLSVGVKYVFVNGVITLKNGKLTSNRGGQILKRAQ
ncbi:MAG: D-aminoacylase [Fimbriimonadaceae bacterium]